MLRVPIRKISKIFSPPFDYQVCSYYVLKPLESPSHIDMATFPCPCQPLTPARSLLQMKTSCDFIKSSFHIHQLQFLSEPIWYSFLVAVFLHLLSFLLVTIYTPSLTSPLTRWAKPAWQIIQVYAQSNPIIKTTKTCWKSCELKHWLWSNGGVLHKTMKVEILLLQFIQCFRPAFRPFKDPLASSTLIFVCVFIAPATFLVLSTYVSNTIALPIGINTVLNSHLVMLSRQKTCPPTRTTTTMAGDDPQAMDGMPLLKIFKIPIPRLNLTGCYNILSVTVPGVR